MDWFRRLDGAWARAEARLLVAVLMSMVFVASFAAGVRNLTHFDFAWANALLMDMEWADSFLRKATMWLAFLGASQAVYHKKHISIDVLLRMAPLRARYSMHAVSGLLTGLITLALMVSLTAAVKLNLAERPIEYELLGDSGSIHVCDATNAQLGELDGVARPQLFCSARSALEVIGVRAETPGAMSQLVVPGFFLIMSLRFFGRGLAAAVAVTQGPSALQRLETEEQTRLAQLHAALGAAGRDPSESAS